MGTVKLMLWWHLADIFPELMYCCETMAKVVCRASKLKSDHYSYRKEPTLNKYCDLCHSYAIEDIEHIIVYCPALFEIREKMYAEIAALERENDVTFFNTGNSNLKILLGKIPEDIDINMVYRFQRTVAINVHRMYITVLNKREGIG